MAYYSIVWKKSAQKDLKALPKVYIKQIMDTVSLLKDNPLPKGVKKLSGQNNAFRIRVSDYRIIYNYYKNQITIEIIRVRHRKNVYT